jgi:hypothetical protein
MNDYEPMPNRIWLRLFVAVLAVACGVIAVLIVALELRGVLA